MAQYVATKFRKHPLSFIGGGCTIITCDIFNESKIYDKIKYPKKYIDAMLEKSKNIAEIYLDNQLIWSRKDQEPKPRRLVPIYRQAA